MGRPNHLQPKAKQKIKLKGRQLSEMQTHIVLINYAIEKALQDCFLRQEVFDLMDSAQAAGQEMERLLGV